MKRFLLPLLCGPFLLACSPGVQTGGSLNEAACENPGNSACVFFNSPVRLSHTITKLPGRPYVFRETLNAMSFVDSTSQNWIAPAATLTDGASIPPAFVKIVGAPDSPEYTNAAVIHDAYCGIGNEAGPNYHTRHWRAVHRTFYEALRAGGTPQVTAKVMYAAVMFGGPRWTQIKVPKDSLVTQNADPQLDETELNFPGRPDLQGIPVGDLQARFAEIAEFVRRTNPPLATLEAYIRGKEAEVIQTFILPAPPQDDDDDEPADTGYEDDYNYDEYKDPTAGGSTTDSAIADI